MGFTEILKLIIPYLIAFILFLILREVMCWYWKINTLIRLLEDIVKKMSEMPYKSFGDVPQRDIRQPLMQGDCLA